MTREDAIKTLKELRRETNDPWYEEVYNMAINALEIVPSWIGDVNGREDEPLTCSFSDCDNFKNPDYERCVECKRKQIESKTEPRPRRLE